MEDKTNSPTSNSITNPAITNSLSPKLLLALTLLFFLGMIGFAIFLLQQKVVNKKTLVKPQQAQIPSTIPSTLPRVEQLSLSSDEQIAKELATASAQLLSFYQQNDEVSIQKLKEQLLKADNLSLVALGTALNFIPLERIKIFYGSLEDAYELRTYGLELNDAQYNQLINSIPKTTLYNERPYEHLPSDAPNWLSFGEDGIVQNHEHLLKDGYVCHIKQAWCVGNPEENEKNCENFPLDFENWTYSNGTECCRSIRTKRPYYFACAYAQEPYDNNTIRNKSWMYHVLTQAGIDCTNACLEPYRDEVYILLPDFVRKISYNEDNGPSLKQLTVSSMIDQMRNFRNQFSESGWHTQFTDPDYHFGKCQSDWCKNPPAIQKTLVAKNEKFHCFQQLEVWLNKDDKVVKQGRKVSCRYRDGANLDLD